MAKVIITAKGSKMPTNNWKEGQVIECHENIAKLFITRGIATDMKAVVELEEKPDSKKMKKK